MEKESIWYAGAECFFVQEFPDTSEALEELQKKIDQEISNGRRACALHDFGKHQLFVEKKK